MTISDPVSKQLGFQFVSLAELSPEQKQVLRDSVAKGTTDTQLTYFLNVALSQNLDPFRKEVWCVLYGSNLMIQTSRDGFLKIAKRDPTFDRIQSAEVREGDHFAMDPISGEIEHRFTAKRGAIVGAWAVITRKDGTKVSKYVTFSEYNDPNSNIWKDYPTAMVTKCVESVLCKQFANVTGIIAEEMMDHKNATIDSSPVAQEQQSTLKDRLIAKIQACTTPEQFEAVKQELAGVVGKLFGPEKDAVFEAAKKKRGELDAIVLEPIHEAETITVPAAEDDPKVTINDKPIKRARKPKDVIEATPQLPIELPAEEMAELMDALRAHDTLDGLENLWSDLILPKPKSPEQQAALEAAYQQAKKELSASAQ